MVRGKFQVRERSWHTVDWPPGHQDPSRLCFLSRGKAGGGTASTVGPRFRYRRAGFTSMTFVLKRADRWALSGVRTTGPRATLWLYPVGREAQNLRAGRRTPRQPSGADPLSQWPRHQ